MCLHSAECVKKKNEAIPHLAARCRRLITVNDISRKYTIEIRTSGITGNGNREQGRQVALGLKKNVTVPSMYGFEGTLKDIAEVCL